MKTNCKHGILALAALLVVSLVVCGLVVPAKAAGTTYYVDCAAGDDGAAGTSTSTAWRTTTRANQQTYGPGDSILFKRGTTCSGDRFQPVGDGTAAEPVTIADYGSGDLPAIDGVGEHEPAIMLLNVKHYVLRNLNLTQHGQTPQEIPGPEYKKDADQQADEYMRAVLHIVGLGPLGDENCGEACTVRDVTLENLEVHHGQWKGIFASGGFYKLDGDRYGHLDGLTLQNVESWGHQSDGFKVTCTYYKSVVYTAKNIQVFDSTFHDNGGDGAVLGPVENGLFDGCEAAYNGQIYNDRAGLWTWDSLNTTIQFSESHHTMTPLSDKHAACAGGFDLDLGTEDGMIQYSWSHDNEGVGFLMMTWPIGYGFSRGVTHNAQMRYNVGERDAQKLNGAIKVYGHTEPAVAYNNTIYYVAARDSTAETKDTEGGLIVTSTWSKSGKPLLHVYNNILIADGTVYPTAVNYLVRMDGGGDFFFDNNIHYRVEGGVLYKWGNSDVTTWADWQALGHDPNGLNVDPMIVGPLGGGPAAYKLQAGSPAIDGGRNVTEALRGMGTRDYFGVSIPQGSAYDIGMAEFEGGGPPPTDTPVPPTDTPVPPTDTPVPPTDTPVPPTDTPIPPTDTPGPPPTDTPIPPTDTPAPPTDTPVPPTDTPIPPTDTPVPPTDTPAPTATPGGSTVMHVEDIYTTDEYGTPKDVFYLEETIYWRVLILDQGSAPVEGADVRCSIERSNGTEWLNQTRTTGADGWAYFDKLTKKNTDTDTCTIYVDNVDKTGATYDPNANVKDSHQFELLP